MRNLEYLLTNPDIKVYTDDEMIDILKKECELNGQDLQLTVCMEEFAELIEVLSEYSIHGRIDKLHLKEEIVDCHLCVGKLSIIYNIPRSNITSDIGMYSNNNAINNAILNLSIAVQKLSKCIRKKDGSDMKVLSIMNLVHETLTNLNDYFNIKDEDLTKIISLKIKRSEERNISRIQTADIKLDMQDIDEHEAIYKTEPEIIPIKIKRSEERNISRIQTADIDEHEAIYKTEPEIILIFKSFDAAQLYARESTSSYRGQVMIVDNYNDADNYEAYYISYNDIDMKLIPLGKIQREIKIIPKLP